MAGLTAFLEELSIVPLGDRMSETLLWTFQEAARQLGVSVRTVQRQVKTGGLPCIALGRLRRIPADAARE